MQIFWTIITGVTVYILGEILVKFVLEPIQAQRATIGEIVDFLIYRANTYTSPGVLPYIELNPHASGSKEEKLLDTQVAARTLASQIMVKTQAIPFYGLWAMLRLVKKRSAIRTAQRGLFYLSNALFDETQAISNYKMAQAIEGALGVSTEFKVTEGDKAPPTANQ
jgi:hypothetical protein